MCVCVCVCPCTGVDEKARGRTFFYFYIYCISTPNAPIKFNCIPSRRVVQLASHVQFGGKPRGGFTRRSSISHTRIPTCTAPVNHALHAHTRKRSEQRGGASNNTGWRGEGEGIGLPISLGIPRITKYNLQPRPRYTGSSYWTEILAGVLARDAGSNEEGARTIDMRSMYDMFGSWLHNRLCFRLMHTVHILINLLNLH